MSIDDQNSLSDWDLQLRDLRSDVTAFASELGDRGFLTVALSDPEESLGKYPSTVLGAMPIFLRELPLSYSVCVELYQISTQHSTALEMLRLAKGGPEDRETLVQLLEQMVRADELLGRAGDLKSSSLYYGLIDRGKEMLDVSTFKDHDRKINMNFIEELPDFGHNTR